MTHALEPSPSQYHAGKGAMDMAICHALAARGKRYQRDERRQHTAVPRHRTDKRTRGLTTAPSLIRATESLDRDRAFLRRGFPGNSPARPHVSVGSSIARFRRPS